MERSETEGVGIIGPYRGSATLVRRAHTMRPYRENGPGHDRKPPKIARPGARAAEAETDRHPPPSGSGRGLGPVLNGSRRWEWQHPPRAPKGRLWKPWFPNGALRVPSSRRSPAQRVRREQEEQGSAARNPRQGVASGADFATTRRRGQSRSPAGEISQSPIPRKIPNSHRPRPALER